MVTEEAGGSLYLVGVQPPVMSAISVTIAGPTVSDSFRGASVREDVSAFRPPRGATNSPVSRPRLARRGDGALVNEGPRYRLSIARNPLLPTDLGKTEKRTSDYVRHGTTNLFAALEVHSGHVHADWLSRRRRPSSEPCDVRSPGKRPRIPVPLGLGGYSLGCIWGRPDG
jgi:hypothetical protein